MDLRDVTFFIRLPEGLSLVKNTTILTNNANSNGVKMKDSIHLNGFNTGLYGLDGFADIDFDLRVERFERFFAINGYMACYFGKTRFGSIYSTEATIIFS